MFVWDTCAYFRMKSIIRLYFPVFPKKELPKDIDNIEKILNFLVYQIYAKYVIMNKFFIVTAFQVEIFQFVLKS